MNQRLAEILAEKKIEAVKVYREAYNCGLKDAKDAVDLIQAEMRKEARISLPSAPAISNNPFEEDTHRNRRFLAFLIAIVLLVIGGIAFFLLASSGF